MFLQQVNTIATVYLSSIVNTGDKLLDSSLVGVAVIAFSAILMNVATNWTQYYNLFIFYSNKMWNNPLDLRKVNYSIDYYRFADGEEFNKDTRTSIEWISPHRINNKLKILGANITLTQEDILRYVKKYCSESNISSMRDKYHTELYCYQYGSNVYPIGVSKYGNVVYIDTYHCDLRSNSRKDTTYLSGHLVDYIVFAAKEDSELIAKDEIYIPTFTMKDGRSILDMKSIGKINKKKTFDCLYYPQKAELLAILKKFQDGKMYPEHIPMDNKLGILLYGPPGTGKTGTISAIANMLRRSIIIINFAEITTCKQLDEILQPSKYSSFVYVFDEFDCILDVISGVKKTPEKEPAATDWGSMLMFAEGEERKNIISMMKAGRSGRNESPIDMAYLLQKLDGLESAEDRIIIATTNNPDKINPTLLRPGRFDVKICLSLCTSEIVADILTNFYKGDDAMRKRILGAKIPDNKYSPLELVNMAIQAPSIEKLLKMLRT